VAESQDDGLAECHSHHVQVAMLLPCRSNTRPLAPNTRHRFNELVFLRICLWLTLYSVVHHVVATFMSMRRSTCRSRLVTILRVVNMATLRFLFTNPYKVSCIAWAESHSAVQLELYEVWCTKVWYTRIQPELKKAQPAAPTASR